jgi:hypothetical protein
MFVVLVHHYAMLNHMYNVRDSCLLTCTYLLLHFLLILELFPFICFFNLLIIVKLFFGYFYLC